MEYRLAIGLGAQVGVVVGSGKAADAILASHHWTVLPNLLPLPPDAMTLRAFVLPPRRDVGTVENMAREIHRRYVAENPGRLPANMQPWESLDDTYRDANRQQAAYAVSVLEATGFRLRKTPAGKIPAPFHNFTEAELNRMAELEHGRWNAERLRSGWRLGPRDNENKRHPLLIPWKNLDEPTRDLDRRAVSAFPEVLAAEGLEVVRGKP